MSIVICSYAADRWPVLRRAVDSVARQAGADDEVVVVVDHNPGLLATARAAWREGVVENTHRRGLSGARNSGVEASRGEIVAFLDDDAEAAPGWLERVRGAYADAAVMAVGGTVEPAWDGGRPAWFPEEFDWVVGCTFRGMPSRRATVRNVVGANMSFRREVFTEVGGFRDGMGRVGTLPEGCEETDLCIRAGRRWPARRIILEPAARVRHRVPRDRATWSYFLARCHAEGVSKARLSRFVGTRDGLASERAYTARTLPAGTLRGLGDAILRRDRSGLRRAGAIVLGLAATTTGYARTGAARTRRIAA